MVEVGLLLRKVKQWRSLMMELAQRSTAEMARHYWDASRGGEALLALGANFRTPLFRFEW